MLKAMEKVTAQVDTLQGNLRQIKKTLTIVSLRLTNFNLKLMTWKTGPAITMLDW